MSYRPMFKQNMSSDPIDFESINDIDLDLNFWIEEVTDFIEEDINNLERAVSESSVNMPSHGRDKNSFYLMYIIILIDYTKQ